MVALAENVYVSHADLAMVTIDRDLQANQCLNFGVATTICDSPPFPPCHLAPILRPQLMVLDYLFQTVRMPCDEASPRYL